MRTKNAIYQKPRNPETISGVRNNRYTSVYDMKNNMDFDELCSFFDENHAVHNYSNSQAVFGNPLPKSYESLGKIHKSAKIYISQSLVNEINWTLVAVRKYRVEISLFLEYRKIYEHAFLLGDYSTAERYLTKIENEICFSLWTLQNRYLLLEFKDSPEANKSFLSDTNKSLKGYFIPSFAHFLSNRAEKNVSVSRYNLDLYEVMSRVKGSLAEGNRELYYFKLNKFDYPNYTNLMEVLTLDLYHSIIDRYLTLISVLKISIANEEFPNAFRAYLLAKIKYVITRFDEPTLLTTHEVFSKQSSSQLRPIFDLGINDLFVSGLYKDCINRVRVALQKDPSNFEYYLLYVKSFLFSDTKFELPSKDNSFQNRLLTAVYEHLNKKISPADANINLNRLLKNLHEFSISEPIHNFIFYESGLETKFKKELSLSFNNPDVITFFSVKTDALDYLAALNRRFPNSVSINLHILRLQENYDSTLLDFSIPQITKSVETAQYLQEKCSFEAAKKKWLDVINDFAHIVPIYQIATENLFYCYVELLELNNAINMYVQLHMENPFIAHKIDVKGIHEVIRRSRFRSIATTIESCLFYTYTKADENEIHITYERFLNACSTNRPSLLNHERNNVPIDKLVQFLHLVCTTTIFKHSIFINGSKDGLSERIAVCRILMTLDPDQVEVYKAEINEITDALIVQEGLQHLDESKIYVNEQGLINSELKEFEGLFNRYKTISHLYQKEKKLLIYDKKRGVRLASVNDFTTIVNDQYSADPLRDAFADIFDVITRKFLFSKFGISAYLSTRIRHGVLLGEIRPIFENYSLISQKDAKFEEYLPVQFWNNDSRLNLYQKELLQANLAKFSAKIDLLINELISDRLQIRTEDENLAGWFNFYFDDTHLGLHAIAAMEIEDFPDFVKRVIEILWERTDNNLADIRTAIQGVEKAKFNEAIEDLTKDLQQVLMGNDHEIFTSINTCLTDIQNSLNRIAGWFNRSGSQTSDFKIDKLISVVLENVSHSYSRRRLNLLENNSVDLLIKGEYYTHFADLFRIFLDNALKHSNQSIEVIDAAINVGIDGDQLSIEIINSDPDPTAKAGIITFNNAKNTRLTKEGKSGFPKARKIICSDLKNDNNSYHMSEDEGNRVKVKINLELKGLIA